MTQPMDGQVYKASDGWWYRWPDATPHDSEEAAQRSPSAPMMPPPIPMQYPAAGWPQQGPVQPTAAAPAWGYGGATADTSGSWFGRHKVLTAVGGVFALLLIGGMFAGSNDPEGASSESFLTDAGAADPTGAADAPGGADNGGTYAGKLKGDQLAKADRSARISGWTVTTTPLVAITDGFLGPRACTTVTLTNRDDEEQSFNVSGWKLQVPSGAVRDWSLSGENSLDITGAVAPGGRISGDVCFDGALEKGVHVMSWQPDIFTSKDRIVWLDAH